MPNGVCFMKKIQLGGHRYKNHPIRGYALVDDGDFEWLNQWEWSISHGYARRVVNNKPVYMHRVILCPPRNKQTDHIDGNKLNNQRKNLRACTNSQNNRNKGFQSNNKSGVIGVCWGTREQKWRAELCVMGKKIRLGDFIQKRKAIKARQAAEIKYFGEFRHKT